jgi:hypothetical protein
MSTGDWFTLCGIIVAVLAVVVTVRHNNRNSFNIAAEKFRAAFYDELMILDPIMSTCPPNIHRVLDDALNKHRAAMEEFLPVLRKASSFDAGGLEEAWNKYHRSEEFTDFPHVGLVKYSGIACGTIEARNRKLLAKTRIEGILYYAQHR